MYKLVSVKSMLRAAPPPPPPAGGGGGGGDSDMKGTGMLVVSLRGINFSVLGKMSLFLAVKVSFRVAHKEITKKKEV